MQFRLLKTGHKSAAENMSIDEAVLDAIAEGHAPATLRFYGWAPPAISIGYFQSLEEEVDLEACKKHGIEFVRRITGGGAVLHEHEVTYSMHIPEISLLVPAGILESYRSICEGILKGLSHVNLQSQFVPLNDIVVNVGGSIKKISGNAQTRKKGVILQHGTLLLKVDVDKMFSLLKVPSEKLKGKLIEDVKQRVTSVSDACGREVSFDEGVSLLHKGFSEAFRGIELHEGDLTQAETMRVEKLCTEKYRADEWNKKR